LKKYIALDIGDVRIGVAKSDATGILVTPLTTIDRKKTKALDRILEICQAEETTSIVAGIPKSLDGTEKRQAEKVRIFLQKLHKAIPEAEIIEFDERFTTVTANRILHELQEKWGAEKRKYIDKVAAAVILENFLECLRKKNNIWIGGNDEKIVD
jgi:putative Holliday junction resolvase